MGPPPAGGGPNDKLKKQLNKKISIFFYLP